MSELNDTETQLRALTPRRPSPALKQRIFAAAAALKQQPRSASDAPEAPHHPSWAWLAPVTAALLVVAVVYNQRNPTIYSSSASSPMVALALSNQSAAAWLPGSFAHEVNALPEETLEWTNGSRSTSSISSLSGSRGTN